MVKKIIDYEAKVRDFIAEHPDYRGTIGSYFSKKDNKYGIRVYIEGKQKKLTPPIYDYVQTFGKDFGPIEDHVEYRHIVKKDNEIFVADSYFNIILGNIDFIAQINRGDYACFFIKEERTGIIDKNMVVSYYDESYKIFDKREIDFGGREIDYMFENEDEEEIDEIRFAGLHSGNFYANDKGHTLECEQPKEIDCFFCSDNQGYYSLEQLYNSLGIKWVPSHDTLPFNDYEKEIYKAFFGNAKTMAETEPQEIEIPKGKEFNISDIILVIYTVNDKDLKSEIYTGIRTHNNGHFIDGFFYFGKYYRLSLGDTTGANFDLIWEKK